MQNKLRELINTAIAKAMALSARLGIQPIVYRLIWWVLSVVRKTGILHRLSPGRYSILQAFIRDVRPDLDDARLEEMARFSLQANVLHQALFINQAGSLLSTGLLQRRCRVSGLRSIRNYFEGPDAHGVILVGGHMTAQKIVPWRLAEDLGCALKIIPPLPKPVESAMDYIVPLMEARDVLQKNGIVLILPDGVQGQNVTRFPFLNKSALFSPGFTTLAMLEGSPIVPVHLGWERDGSFTIRLGQPFEGQHKGEPFRAFSERSLQTYIRWLEEVVRECPESVNFVNTFRYVSASHDSAL